MKLSEAIRKGAEGRKQYRGSYQENERVCALGAAFIACTGKTPVEATHCYGWVAQREFVNRALADCCDLRVDLEVLPHPAKAEKGRPEHIEDIIWWLNDKKRLSFDPIAAWLEEQGL